ncbi:hypothetical protein [Ruegeria arenilitoris]|uniref:hypothetical protein n=1 Tax=Ruegeria arenilitoris TaxID=1173585 RepID=UPI00148034C6|nr:hypothetical protein [Ruegeria arenilitoris]
MTRWIKVYGPSQKLMPVGGRDQKLKFYPEHVGTVDFDELRNFYVWDQLIGDFLRAGKYTVARSDVLELWPDGAKFLPPPLPPTE